MLLCNQYTVLKNVLFFADGNFLFLNDYELGFAPHPGRVLFERPSSLWGAEQRPA